MKQYESLYINGQLVNIGTSDITLEWKSVMFSNISKLKVNHSYTIKLPMTANNRKVFTMAESAQYNSVALRGTNSALVNGETLIGKRLSARYYCNGVDLLGEANAYLIGTDGEYYKVVLTWGTLSSLRSVIDEDRNLPEIFNTLGIEPIAILFTQSTTSRLSDALGDDVLCLRYDSGVIGDAYYNYLYYLPSVKVTFILKWIFEKYNIDYDLYQNYTENGIQVQKIDPLLDSLYCPIVTANDSEYVQNLCKFQWSFYAPNTEYGDGYTLLVSKESPNNDRVYFRTINEDFNRIYCFVGKYENMKYKIKTHIRCFIDVDRIGMNEAEVFANIKLCIVNGKRDSKDSLSKKLSLVPTYISSEWLERSNSNKRYYEVRFEYTEEYEETDSIDSTGNDEWKNEALTGTICFQRLQRMFIIDGYDRAIIGKEQVGNNGENVYWLNFRSEKTGLNPTDYDNYVEIIPVITEFHPYVEPSGLHDTSYPSYIYIEPNFPDMKPIDFLKAVFYIIGAYPVIVDGKLKLSFFNEIVSNYKNAYDWSECVIGTLDPPSGIDFVLDDWSKKNWFWWKNDDEDNPKFSNYFEIEDPYLNDEDDVFTLPFEGSETSRGISKVPIYESGKVINTLKYKGAWGELGFKKFEEVDGFVFKGCKPRIGIRKPSNTVQNVDDIDSGLETLTFEELSFRTDNGLMESRYKVFVEMLRHPYVLKCTMDIDEMTLGSLNMSIPVYLRQLASYFAISSIKRKSDGKCSVELLKIPNTLLN